MPLESNDLGQPLAPPQLSRNQALLATRNAGWEEWLFSHPLSAEYGSQEFSLSVNGRRVGRIDIWRITIRDVSIPRPGGPIGLPAALRPPPATTLKIYVDDKAGNVVMAERS